MKVVFIKNMVCDRCIASVSSIFDKQHIPYLSIKLGKVMLLGSISKLELELLATNLKRQGFELLDSAQPVLVTRIKAALVEVYSKEEVDDDFKLSTYLTKRFSYNYSHLSRVFSHHEKDTIEQYLIKLRIEKAKELLMYKDRNISEVAYILGYTSTAHFSRQFKKLVGLSPSSYQNSPTGRNSLEDL